jgi:glycine/D-amino acid oxidase-like deaminating enzyme
MTAPQYRRLSLWHDTIDDDWTARPALDGDTDVDIAIVGAGYTGLWTAYWLSEFQPDARIVVLESQVAGFGASGRNGGWCSALFPTSLRRLASASSRQDAIALQRAMNDTVPHIGRIAAKEGIDCDFAHGGYVSMARNKAHLVRARSEVKHWRSWGFGSDDVDLLTAEQTRARVGATDILGGTFFAHCAALHPAKLVRGLARVVQARGVRICELTEATRLSPGEVRTRNGRVRADVVVRATEGYTPLIPGIRDSRRHRLDRTFDILRQAAPAYLRAAHRRREDRLRRTWRALPLRVEGRTGLRSGRAGARHAATHSASAVPGAGRCPVHPRLGR